MPKLYLHAGTHKTGTTAIQDFAARNRGALLARGMYYPGYRPFVEHLPKAQHRFAHALAEVSSDPLTLEQASTLPAHWMAEAQHHDADIFVSVEALYRHVLGEGTRLQQKENYLRRVAAVLREFEVVIVLVFRRPDNYIRSLYQERVMRMAIPLPSFRSVRNREVRDRTELQYHTNAGLFADIFPEVRYLIYEDLVASRDFISMFFRTIGLDVSDLDELGVVRKSLSVPETRVKNFANKFIADRDRGEAFLKWIRTPEIARLITDAFRGHEYDLWESHGERKSFLRSRDDDLDRLHKGYFENRSRLFPPLSRGETATCAPEVPEDLRRKILDYLGVIGV